MEQKYKIILFDVDDTLLDFGATERQALDTTLDNMGYAPTDDLRNRYKEINHDLWRRYEQGEIERSEVLDSRFKRFFAELGKSVDGKAVEKMYREELGKGAQLIDNATETCKKLSQDHLLYIVTNGVAETQMRRLTASGLILYFRKIFVSETVGYQKPSIKFFEHVFANIEDVPKDKIIIIGDSLSSDIKGGIDAGIDTCWANFFGNVNSTDIIPKYEIKSLLELDGVL